MYDKLTNSVVIYHVLKCSKNYILRTKNLNQISFFMIYKNPLNYLGAILVGNRGQPLVWLDPALAKQRVSYFYAQRDGMAVLFSDESKTYVFQEYIC